MDLPQRNYKFYAGIDPGFSGAIGLMSAEGTMVRVWDMPITTKGTDRTRELDLAELWRVIRSLRSFPDCVVGVEWPTTRPGEGAERSERFGRQKGVLEAMLYCIGAPYHKLAPNLWKGRLGLPGKDNPNAKSLADTMFHNYYPEYGHIVRGPKGGLLDGRCEALLIAHYLRTRTVTGMRDVIERFGKDSKQAIGLVFGGKRRRRKPGTPNFLG